jgi:hypothetical protein
MAKKSKMSQEVEKSEQLDLIDVQPKNAKEIVNAAKLYKKFQAARLSALEKETNQKQTVLELIKKAKLQPLDGGVIKFKNGGIIVTVKPRDELVQVKEEE